MREILFRGKRIDNGEWVEGYLILKGNQTFISSFPYFVGKVHETSWLEFCFGGFIEVIPETVGQYTGLTDKNGKKIFEGDIVRTHYANAPKAVFVETVVFDGGKFCATSTNEGCKTTAALWDGVPRLAIDKSVYMDEVEVIGNIYDNPELLEVGE